MLDAIRRAHRRMALGAGLSLGAVLGMGATAEAATFTVTNLDDAGGGSLRDALEQANATEAPDQILFQSGLTGTLTLTSGGLQVDEPVIIQGPGADLIAVSGDDIQRVIAFTTNGDPAVLYGLTLTRGRADGAGGGAILNQTADLRILRSTISNSRAEKVSGPAGGGIRSLSGTTTRVEDSTISGNAAGNGAGIYAEGTDLLVLNSTITGNDASGYGGGIWADGGSGGSLLAYGSTISENSAQYGGGITSANHSPDPALSGTIVADDTAALPAETDLRNAGGDAFQIAFSLVESSPGAANLSQTVPGSNLIGVDPELGELADNGGQMQTLLPGVASPVLDQGGAALTAADQRGITRPVDLASVPNAIAPGDGSDIGAVELTLAEATPPPAPSATPPPGPSGTPPAMAPVPAPIAAPPRAKRCKKKHKKKHKHKRSARAAKKCKKKRR